MIRDTPFSYSATPVPTCSTKGEGRVHRLRLSRSEDLARRRLKEDMQRPQGNEEPTGSKELILTYPGTLWTTFNETFQLLNRSMSGGIHMGDVKVSVSGQTSKLLTFRSSDLAQRAHSYFRQDQFRKNVTCVRSSDIYKNNKRTFNLFVIPGFNVNPTGLRTVLKDVQYMHTGAHSVS